ncbi:hypothetical protein DICSQDRAFT_47572 [Dichomitus squalens LYAD-421 SS1]|uniref:uncharacterized protein n=1 Tax=Dichomitus squalens (strain LYAD-421) TaxID=732165 RepID=UPI0004412FD7|nr:uncharacterized protein DICSQDRAFT_47572 [Dichomitus squalens LYAD-421 SS1]EJF66875.1 hypothetical protein DICSQDRAFT_47572 [Dichomitus squalens LYAD-421 SS1]
MSPIQFKFSRPPDGLVRRVTFQERPSWEALAAKIESLYNIPLPSVGVSYVDDDGDEVTLSSEEELQDFYQGVLQQRDGTLMLVKLNVHDLDSLRNDKPLPDTPRTGSAMNYRNTFGRSAPVLFEMEIDDGWQPIPSGLGGIIVEADGEQPHAFVEVLDSDADISYFNKGDKDDASVSTNSTNTLPEIDATPTTDKGKRRARSASLRRSQTPDTISSTQSIIAEEETGPKHPIHVFAMGNSNVGTYHGRSTSSRSRSVSALGPRTPTPKARTPVSGTGKSTSTPQADDPPLPDLDDVAAAPQTNIANDVANLFSTLSTILASHPELSEGIRNIVRNASNGTYWQTHRDQVVRAAEEIRRSAIMGAEDVRQAALGGGRAAEEAAGRRVADALAEVIRVMADITDTGTQGANPNVQSSSAPGPAGPPPPHHGHFGHYSWDRRHRHHYPGEWDDDDPFVGPPRHGGERLRGWRRHPSHGADWGDTTKDVHDSPISPPGASGPSAAAGPSAQASASASPQASQEQAEAAPQVISNARGPFPRLELYSIPRRSHTVHGTGHRRNTNAGRTAAIDSIVHRLAEMGITSNQYPVLQSKVDSHIPLNGEVSKEREDTIVGEIIEELLVAPPSPQQASGSGARRK